MLRQLTHAKQPELLLLVVWYAFTWSWVLFTDSLDLAGSRTQGLVLAIFVIAVNIALSTGLVWNCIKYIKLALNRSPSWVQALAFIPLFAFMDFLVSWFVAVIWIGPQGNIDSILPLSSPSLLLINTPLGFAARLIGFYGLASFFWATAVLVTDRKLRVYSAVPVLILATLSVIGWQVYRTPSGTEFKATVITETLDERASSISPKDAQLVVFPEYGLDSITNKNLTDRIKSSEPDHKTYFLGSEMEVPAGKVGHYNVRVYGNNVDGITARQNKYRLIPGGEDLPYTIRTILRATNQKATLDYFSYAKGVIKGDRQLDLLSIDANTILGSAVCSSIIAPQDYRSFARDGATVFTNSASLTIFKGSPLFSWQQKSLARFMSIANSRYFLQSANAARAYVLDNSGKTLVEARGVQTLNTPVKNNHTRTIYTMMGEWLAFAGAAIVIGLLYKGGLPKKLSKGLSQRKKS